MRGVSRIWCVFLHPQTYLHMYSVTHMHSDANTGELVSMHLPHMCLYRHSLHAIYTHEHTHMQAHTKYSHISRWTASTPYTFRWTHRHVHVCTCVPTQMHGHKPRSGTWALALTLSRSALSAILGLWRICLLSPY